MDKAFKNLCTFLGTLVVALALFGAGAILAGCNQMEKRDSGLPVVHSSGGGTYKVTTVDGCEYIAFYTKDGWWVLTHKGNCTNRIHIYRTDNGK